MLMGKNESQYKQTVTEFAESVILYQITTDLYIQEYSEQGRVYFAGTLGSNLIGAP